MKFPRLFIFILILPLTLFLDLLLFASGLKCASCGDFWLYLSSQSALSFPIIGSLSGTAVIFSEKFFNTNKKH